MKTLRTIGTILGLIFLMALCAIGQGDGFCPNPATITEQYALTYESYGPGLGSPGNVPVTFEFGTGTGTAMAMSLTIGCTAPHLNSIEFLGLPYSEQLPAAWFTSPNPGASIYTLVGFAPSGTTTVLVANPEVLIPGVLAGHITAACPTVSMMSLWAGPQTTWPLPATLSGTSLYAQSVFHHPGAAIGDWSKSNGVKVTFTGSQ